MNHFQNHASKRMFMFMNGKIVVSTKVYNCVKIREMYHRKYYGFLSSVLARVKVTIYFPSFQIRTFSVRCTCDLGIANIGPLKFIN